MIEFNPQQQDALTDIRQWFDDAKDGGQQVFRLFGFAGTGKTTLAKEMRSFVGHVQYASLTGKAALVLRGKGCDNARTIHSMIYRSQDKSRVERDGLKGRLEALMQTDPPPAAAEVEKIRREIEQMNRDLQRPTFLLNENCFDRYWDQDAQEFVTLQRPDLLCIDECSMVDARIGHDLESFGIPILVLGDPAQLPPVAGGGYFTGNKDVPLKPDALLTEIHRQAEGNPILQIATACRTSGMPDRGSYGTSRIVGKADLTPDEWMAADQILTGRNATRTGINQRIRALKGFSGFLPCIGERLVCLRNNHDKGLLNGSMWEVLDVTDLTDGKFFSTTLQSLDDPEAEIVHTIGHKKPFMGIDFEDHYERRDADEFDYGYAITTHKAQGSEWRHVIYVDEWPGSERKRHQYTGVTRASETITVVKWNL